MTSLFEKHLSTYEADIRSDLVSAYKQNKSLFLAVLEDCGFPTEHLADDQSLFITVTDFLTYSKKLDIQTISEIFTKLQQKNPGLTTLATIKKVLEKAKKDQIIDSISLDNNNKPELPKDFFEAKLAKELQPSDLLGLRAQERNGFRENIYLEREEVDLKIYNLIKKRKNVIISGKPLAGKSRTILEQLKRNFSESTVYLANKDIDINISKIESLINHNKDDESYFYIFNDIDNFIEQKYFNNLIVKIIAQSENNIILASCRTIYVKSVFDSLGNELNALFAPIKINSLDEELRKKLDKLDVDRDSLIKDDTIGSYFFPLSEMKSRYIDLEKNRENNKAERIQYEILRSYKCIEFWRRNNRGVKDIIIEYAQKRLLNHYPVKSNVSPYEWKQSIKVLARLGFIKHEGKKISIESAYVEKIIANQESEEEFVFEIIGYYPTVENASKLIYRVSKKELSWQLYDHMRHIGIKPDHYTFNSLLTKTSDRDKILNLLCDMRRAEVKPNEFTFNILIKQQNNFDDAWQTYQKMLKQKIEPSVITFNTLLSKTNNFDDAWQIYLKLLDTDIEFSESTFYCLISKTSNFEQAIKIFRSYCSSGFEPNIKFLESTLSKFHLSNENPVDFNKEVMYVHEQILKFGLVHTTSTFRILLASMPDFESAWDIYQEAVNSKKIEKSSPTIFTQLIDKAETYDQANKPFSEMMRKVSNSEIVGLTINPFNKLIEKAPDFTTAWSIFEYISKYQLSYDSCTFSNLMLKTDDRKERDFILLEAKKRLQHIDDIKYTRNSLYASIISKTKSFEESWIDFEKLLGAGTKPNLVSLFYYLIRKTDNYKDSQKVYQKMLDMEIQPDLTIFNILILKADNFQDSWQIYQKLLDTGIEFSEPTFYCLIRKTSNFEQAIKVFRSYCSFGFEPNMKFIESTLGKFHLSNENPVDFNKEVMYVHEQILKFNFVHTTSTFRILIASMPNFESAWDIYQEVVNSKKIKKSSPTIFTQLIDKAETYDQANKPFSEMMRKVSNSEIIGLTINPFNKLIEKAPDFTTAWSIFEYISKYQLSYDSCTFESLIRKANSIQDRNRVLEEAESNYTKNSNNLNKIFAEEQRKSFYELLKQTSCFKDAVQVYQEMIDREINLSPSIFLRILQKVDRTKKEAFNEAMYVHNLMCKKDVIHNSPTLDLLLKCTPDFDTAWRLYRAIERDNRVSEISFHVFATLISKANKNEKRKILEFVKTKYPKLVTELNTHIKPKSGKPILKKKKLN
ncbi:hypothetical protein H1P_2320008 [Hyella patelloides LEGE 07179]|uniref:Uncharacterized protein n=1 Tax=Hyella patelloides LEGE 07179 TaxID=945734 RepID=A0A563VRI7_9CYAN|nr:pentatricopeptide repeat-containing protein [Hyella patelloides]VEP14023.1 hypothetical protein H1P_2320008 [Hyella patelloides LEGE 07179]